MPCLARILMCEPWLFTEHLHKGASIKRFRCGNEDIRMAGKKQITLAESGSPPAN